jgi:vitamin B12 transporter
MRRRAVAPAPVASKPTVTAPTRLPTPEDQVGSSVTVISGDDIKRKQQQTLPDALQEAPGLNIVQTGGPGGTTSVFMRGANANHTKVFIDGIDASDPSVANGSFDFANMLASDIDRIEVLRGPQSGLYGSDAIGGVVNIVTRKGSGPGHLTGSLEGGSFGTFNQTAGASGAVSGFNYAFSAAHFLSTDTPVTPPDLVPVGRPINNNAYENTTLSSRLGASITSDFDVGLTTRYIVSSLAYTSDDSRGPMALRSQYDTRELSSRATAHLVLFNGAFEQTAGVAYASHNREYSNPNPGARSPFSAYEGDRVKFDWLSNVRMMRGQTLTFGAERQLDAIDDSAPLTASLANNAGFAQLQSNFGDRFFNAVSVRYDDNSQFGGALTWRAAPSVLFSETGTRLKASVGTGFKAPTLDQLYHNYPSYRFYANPDLAPETSLGYDAGFEQSLAKKRIQFGATWFHNDIRNLIDYNAAFTSLANIGVATTQGVESFLAVKPMDRLTLRGDFTYTLAQDDVSGLELLRRPREKASVSATWQATEAVSLTATVIGVSPWRDHSRLGSATVTGDGYAVVNLAGAYDLGGGLTAFARADNVFDHHYQDPYGFLRPGVGLYAGVRVALDAPEK